jgi:hypothetical protein
LDASVYALRVLLSVCCAGAVEFEFGRVHVGKDGAGESSVGIAFCAVAVTRTNPNRPTVVEYSIRWLTHTRRGRGRGCGCAHSNRSFIHSGVLGVGTGPLCPLRTVVQRVAQRDMIGAAARDVVHAGVLKVHWHFVFDHFAQPCVR